MRFAPRPFSDHELTFPIVRILAVPESAISFFVQLVDDDNLFTLEFILQRMGNDYMEA